MILQPGRATPRLRLVGALTILAAWTLHAWLHAVEDDPIHLLWACNMALLFVAAGYALNRPAILGVGFIWVVYGTPIWLVDVAAGNPQLWTSYITHFGGIAAAIYGLKHIGVGRGAWWMSVAAFLPLIAISRLITPPDLNINLSHRIYEGFDTIVPSHALYIAILLAGCALVGLGLEVGARALFERTARAATVRTET